jgi:hypothetical protein
MSDVLDSFLKAKGLIKEEVPVKNVPKKGKKELEKPIIVDNSITLKDIIEEKPSKKKILEFLKERMQAYEKEFLD